MDDHVLHFTEGQTPLHSVSRGMDTSPIFLEEIGDGVATSPLGVLVSWCLSVLES